MYLVTADEMQRMDHTTIDAFGIPGRVLMENAGRGATAFFLESVYRHHPGPVGVVAGRGNNGGDGFVMARYLYQKGIPVTVFLLADRQRVSGDAADNLALIDRMGVPVLVMPDADAFDAQSATLHHQCTWIDAILGTGLTADVRGHFHRAIDFINCRERPVFAVDIPSGIHTDTGQVCGIAIRAAATATFGFAKLGHLCYPGRELSGRLKIIEIGIPPHVARQVGARQYLITPDLLKPSLPLRSPTTHKGNTGHLLVLAGSPGKTGAAAMAATAAMRAGAGLVTLGIPRSLNPIVETLVTEAMTVGLPETAGGTLDASALDRIRPLMQDKRCLAMGPGLGTDPATGELMRRLLAAATLPMVVDADGLNLIATDLSMLPDGKPPMVLTPHPGEMARLCGASTSDIQADRVGHARAFATRHGVHLVLKGAATVVAQPDGSVFVNPTGNPGMAAGGMGDVLTGLIAGLIAQGVEVGTAALAGVYLHGAAADRMVRRKAAVGFLAGEVMHTLPEAIDDLRTGNHRQCWPEWDSLAYPMEPPRQ